MKNKKNYIRMKFNNYYISSKKAKGFTLIELLVVISITVFLSTIAVVSLKNAREKARDAARTGELVSIQKALELYYNDNRKYPPASDNGKIGVGSAGINSSLAPYLAKIPADPLSQTDSTNYFYYYDGSQTCANGEYSSMVLVFANKMERTSGNASVICKDSPWANTEAGTEEGKAGAYHVIVGETTR